MLLSDFDYELPEELIAQRPAERRDASRMLVVERASGAWRERPFAELPRELRAGDCLVVNYTRVFPARLAGRREPSGGRVELLLVGEMGRGAARVWETLARPARRLELSARVRFGDGRLRAEVVGVGEGGRRVVRFSTDEDFDALLDEAGRMPLPPYIKRDEWDAAAREFDRERYQTVYAER
ncbi:MAG TPA: S-adenosylmethionine:tRNA ribosyltransferase-isomerase, partial [Pyrinomonadaceae bacterium]|nr:S-adenosylmethionine:tRNA ribosyltransferase-isomerase [Pyrinomonadaceae bacterium]